MNIALFADTFPPEINGVATSTKSLFDILRKNGHNVYAITTNPYNDDVVFEDNVIRLPGIALKKLYNYRLSWIYNSSVMKKLRELKLDVIHVQTESSIGIFGRIVAKNLNLPLVYTYHTMYEEYTYYVTKGKIDRIAKSLTNRFMKMVIEHSTEIISPSQKTKDYMRRIGVDAYINVVPTGVDFSRFKLSNEKMKEVIKKRESLGIDNTTTVFISLGRVAKEKSIDVCLKGYKEFVLHNPTVKSVFLIIGDGPARLELEQLTRDLSIEKKVMFLGKVPPSEVPFYYHLGDIFVSASVTETQGLTFMEAMAANKIVLARFDNNLVGVINDTKTGFFFTDAKDFAVKASHILMLSEDEKKRIKEEALKLINDYSIETFYENIMEVYHRAIRANW